MPKRILHILLTLATIAMAACTVRPRHILSNSEMQSILIDLHHAEGVIDVKSYSYKEKEKEKLCYQYVLQKHNTTQAVFDSSVVWYTMYPSQFERIYERVYTQLKLEENKLLTLIESQEGIIKEPLKLDFLDSTIVSAYPRKAIEPYKQFARAILDSCVLHPIKYEVQAHIFPIGYSDTINIIVPADTIVEPTIILPQKIEPTTPTGRKVLQPIPAQLKQVSTKR